MTPLIANHKSNHPHRVALDSAIAVLNCHEAWRDLLARGFVDRGVLVDTWMEDALVYIVSGQRGTRSGHEFRPRLAVALVNNKTRQVLAIRLVSFESTGRPDEVQTLFESSELGQSVARAKGFRFDASMTPGKSRK